MWRSKVRPDKGFGFSRRTKSMATKTNSKTTALATFAFPSDADRETGIKRFQIRRPEIEIEIETATARDGTSGTDQRVRKSRGQYRNEKHNVSNNKNKNDTADNRRGIPLNNSHGEEGDPSSSLSCGERKNTENPNAAISSISISTIPISTESNSESSAKAKTPRAALDASSESNKQVLPVANDHHRSLSITNANDNLVVPLTPHEPTVNPDSRGIGNTTSSGRKGTSYLQEVKTVDKKKKNTFDVPMTITTVNKSPNKNNRKVLNQEKPIAGTTISQQTVVSGCNKINLNKNECSSNDRIRSRGEFSASRRKITKTKAKRSKANAKKTTPKAKKKKNNSRKATPFVHSRASAAIKNTNEFHADTKRVLRYHIEPGHRNRLSLGNLYVDQHDREFCTRSYSRKNVDQSNNGEEYSCNDRYDHDDKLSREEYENGGIPHPTSSSLLTTANLLAFSIRESSAVEGNTSCGQRDGNDEKEEESNVPETSLWRNKTEDSTDIMGTSPLAEFRRRIASVDEDLRIRNRPSSSVATTGSVNPWTTTMTTHQEQPSPITRHHYDPFSSRAMRKDSEPDPYSSGESDDGSHRYYSKKYMHGNLPMTPKPMQLLDKFNAVALVNAPVKTPNNTMEYPKNRNHYPQNDRIVIDDLRDFKIGIAHSLEIHRDGVSNNAVPKYFIDGKKRENGNNLENRKKDCSVVGHPLRHSITVLDKMITTALKSQKKAKINKSKRKSVELARKVTGNGHDAGSNKKRKSDAFKRKDCSVGPFLKRTKLVLDDESSTRTSTDKSQKHKRARNNARRVSLESPLASNSRHQREELPSTANLGHQRKTITCDDDSSSCWSDDRQQRPLTLYHGQKRLEFDGGDDDSSDWSADWENLSIESIPRYRCHQREDSDQSPHPMANFVEDSSEDEYENVPSAPRSSLRYSEKTGKELAQSDAIIRRKKNSNPAYTLRRSLLSSGEILMINPNLRRVVANCRSSSDSAGGVKKVSIVIHQPIRRILFILYIYVVLWVGHDKFNRLSPCDTSSTFGGIENRKRMRPRIRFSKNPSLSLIQASQMHEATMM